MPLGRFGVRNEYGLGGKELYKEAVESEDPKAVLDGVAVAGLVGLLRQLGDLSQFAAEVFHGLQEQLASTSSRSRKLVTRIHHLEASLPSLEKAMLSQTSHIQFAYAPGSEWHPRIKKEQNHFVCSDLPHFIMDSYEECHEPPRLHLLDRFDARGSGSCLKRYTDPTFFRKASTGSEARNKDKSQQERKARKIRRKRSRQLSGRLPNSIHNKDNNGRPPVSSQTGRGESSLQHTSSTLDRTLISDLRDQSDSRNSKESPGFVGPLSPPSTLLQSGRTKNTEFVSNLDEITMEASQNDHINGQTSPIMEIMDAQRLSNVTWDEKLEITEPMSPNNEIEDNGRLSPETKHYLHEQDLEPVGVDSVNQVDDVSEHGSVSKSAADQHYIDAIVNVKLIDPSGLHYQYEQDMRHDPADEHQEVDLSEPASSPESNIISFHHEEELSEHGSLAESNADGLHATTVCDSDVGHDLMHVNSETSPQIPSVSEVGNDSREQSLVIPTPESSSELTRIDQGESSRDFTSNGNFVKDCFDSKLSIGDIQYMLETIDNNNWALKTVDANQVGKSSPVVESMSEGVNTRDAIADENSASEFDGKLGVDDVQYMLESNVDTDENDGVVETLTGGVNNENVIEWHHDDDIDSGTDNFVDALYTIDSESESDVETYTKKEITSVSRNWDGNASTDLITENEFHSRFNAPEDGLYDGLEKLNVPLSLDNLEHLGSPQSSELSEVATDHEKDADSLNAQSSPSAASSSNETQGVDIGDADSLNAQSSPSAASSSNEAQGVDIGDNTDATTLQPTVHEPVESSSPVSRPDLTSSTPHESREMSFGSVNSYPPVLWTNATLFGLQPSKPTVISNSNSASAAPISIGNGNVVDECSPRVNGPTEATSSSVKNSYCGDNIGSDRISEGVLDKRNNKSLRNDETNISNDAASHKTSVSAGPVSKDVFGEDGSSILSLLGRNLLKSGLRRTASLGYEDKSKRNNPSATHMFNYRSAEAVADLVPQTNMNKKLESPVNSPPPSPPLEHMKISFRPVDGFETSRLKLKYPEGIDNHEMSVETFPSFQLVPEAATRLQHDVGSDSDNDTFCRSYPCISDYSTSHRSDSDSEQWETGETSESNEHDGYDGLRRNASLDSACSSSRFDETDQRLNSQLLSLETKNKFGYEEMKVCLNPEADSSRFQDLAAQPPPLPPLQWQISKRPTHAVQENQEQGSKSLNQSFDSQFVESSNSYSLQDLDVTVIQKKVAEPKVNNQTQSDHGRIVDEEGDFLQQIRTKSFNLKRTEAARSCSPPGLATTPSLAKVSAILQKANAIRQAVGSDGEDDSWSDT